MTTPIDTLADIIRRAWYKGDIGPGAERNLAAWEKLTASAKARYLGIAEDVLLQAMEKGWTIEQRETVKP